MDSARFAAASLSAQQNRLDGLHTHPRPSSAGGGTRAAGSAERESHGWKGTWPGGWRGCSRETSTAAAGFSEGWEGGKRINTAMRPQLDTESARRPGQAADSALRTWPRRLGCTAGSRRWGRTLRGLCAAGPTSPEPAAAAPAAAAAATSTGCTYSAPVRRCALSGISALGCAAPQRGSCGRGRHRRGYRASRGRRAAVLQRCPRNAHAHGARVHPGLADLPSSTSARYARTMMKGLQSSSESTV